MHDRHFEHVTIGGVTFNFVDFGRFGAGAGIAHGNATAPELTVLKT